MINFISLQFFLNEFFPNNELLVKTLRDSLGAAAAFRFIFTRKETEAKRNTAATIPV